jgi:response regulator RpfG family c-di-GMP phosphodiesterase
MMPGMDGIEVCQRLRNDPRLAEMPVIMITALSDDESRLKGIEAGADDFISKPFNSAELRARVRTIVRLNRYRRLASEREQRQQAEARTQRQLQRLAALHDIDMAMTASLNLNDALHVLVEQIPARLGLDAVAVLLIDSSTQSLQHTASHGFRTSTAASNIAVPLSDTLSGQAILSRSPVYANLPTSRHNGTAANGHAAHPLPPLFAASRTHCIMEAEDFRVFYGLPLISRGKPRGVLELFHRETIPPETDWLDFLETLASQVAIAMSNAELFASLQQSYDDTLRGWVKALDLRDKETEGHSQRVTELSVQLARAMGLDEEQVEHIYRGALLHDIGKLGIPDSILLKPGPLTDEEWVTMRKHPVFAYEWLAPIDYLRPALDIPHYHHEKWDGSGYPEGLRGEQIPLAARIFAVIDVWDALSSDRPYRKRWPDEKVHTHLREQSGTHFDPQVVEAFLTMRDRGKRSFDSYASTASQPDTTRTHEPA